MNKPIAPLKQYEKKDIICRLYNNMQYKLSEMIDGYDLEDMELDIEFYSSDDYMEGCVYVTTTSVKQNVNYEKELKKYEKDLVKYEDFLKKTQEKSKLKTETSERKFYEKLKKKFEKC